MKTRGQTDMEERWPSGEEAGVGVAHLQARNHQGLPEATGSEETGVEQL